LRAHVPRHAAAAPHLPLLALPDEHFRSIRVVERRPPYLLIVEHGRFAVVERRNGKLYNLNCGRRAPSEITDRGALAAVGAAWCDERTARRLFDEITARYAELAEHLW
jgi:hypothetical protein